MNCLRSIWSRFGTLWRKHRIDADTDEEMRSHVEMQAQKNIAAGIKPEDARRAAAREFGAMEPLRETCREQRGLFGLETLLGDIRFALRMLRKNPGFTTVRRNPGFTSITVLTQALGIVATSSVFSLIHGMLLTPAPASAD